MRSEVRSAAQFLANLLRLGNCVDPHQLEVFRARLEDSLQKHYQQHWFPENPCKGSGYRCLRINHKMDPIILQAGSSCGLDESALRQLFPHELTLWIDPREVSYRIGENGSICVLFDNNTFQSSSSTTSHSSVQSSPSINHHSPPSPCESSPLAPLTSSCKRSLHRSSATGWENFIMDPRNSQLATFVSS